MELPGGYVWGLIVGRDNVNQKGQTSIGKYRSASIGHIDLTETYMTYILYCRRRGALVGLTSPACTVGVGLGAAAPLGTIQSSTLSSSRKPPLTTTMREASMPRCVTR